MPYDEAYCDEDESACKADTVCHEILQLIASVFQLALYELGGICRTCSDDCHEDEQQHVLEEACLPDAYAQESQRYEGEEHCSVRYIVRPESEPCTRDVRQAVSMKETQKSQSCHIQQEKDDHPVYLYALHTLQRLHVVKFLVESVEGNQFLVLASFYYPAFMHDTDFVCVLDC